MPIDRYYTLGQTGLRVSRMALGVMNFGTATNFIAGWGCDEKTSRAIFDRYLEAGGNFFDTADVYAGGTSEELVGKFIRESGRRDHIVLATKFSQNDQPGNPNAGGNGRKNIMRAVEASLRRLGTDYIDLYILHLWDVLTPPDEVARTLDDLVRSGKVRYVGVSDVPAWYLAALQTLCRLRGFEPMSSMQLQYSLIERHIEDEFVPLALSMGIGITVWSPLASGILSGKYRSREDLSGKGRLGVLAGAPPAKTALKSKNSASAALNLFDARAEAIVAEVRSVAAELQKTVPQIALNWVAGRPAVASVLVGVSRLEQLEDNLRAFDFELPADQRERLDAVSVVPKVFPHNFFEGEWQHRMRGFRSVQSKPPGYYSDDLVDRGNEPG